MSDLQTTVLNPPARYQDDLDCPTCGVTFTEPEQYTTNEVVLCDWCNNHFMVLRTLEGQAFAQKHVLSLVA